MAQCGIETSCCKSAEGEVASCWGCCCWCSGSCCTTRLFTVKDCSKPNWLNMQWKSIQVAFWGISTHRVDSHRPGPSVISGHQWTTLTWSYLHLHLRLGLVLFFFVLGFLVCLFFFGGGGEGASFLFLFPYSVFLISLVFSPAQASCYLFTYVQALHVAAGCELT